MAASFNIIFDNGGADGAPGLNSVIDALGPPNIKFKDADNATIDNANPCPIPGAGTWYARWKHLYVKCTAPPSVQCDNFRFYSDATGWGTGLTCMVGLQFPVKNSGSSAGYEVAGTTNEELVAAHGGITTSADVTGYTAGAPLTGPSISEAGSIINLANETTNYLLLQLNVGSTAGPGEIATRTLYFKYDEV